jgi:iron uptake system EfeUOB component EfeO/EfeM
MMRERWGRVAVVGVCVALASYLAVDALAAPSHQAPRKAGHATATASESEAPPPAPLAEYELHSPHVRSEVSVYSAQGAVGGPNATPPPDTRPVPVSAFRAPIARYRAYALAQLGEMEAQLVGLEGALAAGDRAAAQSAWRGAYADYLRLGAVYIDGQVGVDAELSQLNQQIDGSPGGLPGGASSPKFEGLHRIEYGLWRGAPPSTLLPYARSLAAHVHALVKVLPRAPLTPAEYARRTHEILEDAQRDFLSGTDVPWSSEGVLATDAGLQVTEELIATLSEGTIATLVPVLHKRVIPVVDTELRSVRAVMATLAAAHGGRLPSNQELTQHQTEMLDGTLGGALEALSQIPGQLETELPPAIPQIPPHDFKINPLDP